jgi:hypothetical protein
MITKKKVFRNTKFAPEVLREALGRFTPEDELDVRTAEVRVEDTTWDFDDLSEFFASYRNPTNRQVYVSFGTKSNRKRMGPNFEDFLGTTVFVTMDTKAEIEQIFDVFEAQADASRIPEDKTEEALRKRLALHAHGFSQCALRQADRLHEFLDQNFTNGRWFAVGHQHDESPTLL